MATARATYDRPGHAGIDSPRHSFWPSAQMVLALLLALLAGLALSGLFDHVFGTSRVIPRTTAAANRAASVAAASDYAPRTLVVGYARASSATLIGDEIRHSTHLQMIPSRLANDTPDEAVFTLPQGASVPKTAAAVARLPHVSYAVPDYIAHIAGDFYPDDTGRGKKLKGWEKLQWNFMPRHGVNAPEAWANLLRDHRSGARGVLIAVVDTGIAFRNWKTYKRSPDFNHTRFIDPCDLVLGRVHGKTCTDPNALDRESHGTFVAGTIAESTNNRYSVTGLAYGATIMPVRVLDASGNGDASTIAAGIRYAVQRGARVINLSFVFTAGTTSREIPDVASAIIYAHNHHVVVVGAAGNDEDPSLDYPAALRDVISVGAVTLDSCLASYSDIGKGLDLVAPGGGSDASSVPGSKCHPNRNLPDIHQMTFNDPTHPSIFSLPGGWFGTSMSAPDVTAAAAMVIASGVIGAHPTPAAILARLEATARPLGVGRPNNDYGYGLLNIGAATAKGGPKSPTSTSTTTTTTPTNTTGTTTTATTPTTTDTTTTTTPPVTTTATPPTT